LYTFGNFFIYNGLNDTTICVHYDSVYIKGITKSPSLETNGKWYGEVSGKLVNV